MDRPVPDRLPDLDCGHVPPCAPAQDRPEVLPLSFAQQRLWFLHQLDPHSAQYNVPTALRLSGPLDREVLEAALAEVVARHEVLRTSFPAPDGVPRQVIAPPAPVQFEHHDLSAQPDATSAAATVVVEMTRRPFDLANGPLVRPGLLRLGPDDHVVVVVIHHVVFDGWSMGVLAHELSVIYGALAEGRPSPLAPLALQYGDFTLWQRRWFDDKALEDQIAWWRATLDGAPDVVDLPTDHPRPPQRSTRGASLDYELSEELSEGLRALARDQGATLFMVLLAGFQALLARYSGQQDIAVGVPIAGRTHAELEGLIGFFVNTLVMRTDCSGDPTVEELVARVREVTVGAYAHQDLPFERLVEELQPVRDLSRTPLFEVMLTLDNTPPGTLSLGPVEVEPFAWASTAAIFDLTVAFEDDQGPALGGMIHYNTDLFDADTIGRLGTHLEAILAAMVAAPTARLSQLDILSPAERHQLVVGWNDTAAAYPDQASVAELFEAQVRRSPEATAVVFEGTEVTYADLEARANQLAHHLVDLGVGPEVVVGICVERSVEMVVGVVGILKAGGAYLPLDPDYPAERLALMVDDAGAPVLVTQSRLRDRLGDHQATVVCVDTDAAAIAARPTTPVASGVGACNLAYVIYTSGSTGRPKGVAVEHGGVVNLAAAQATHYGTSVGQRVLQYASFSFDTWVEEFLMALGSGATLCLIRHDELLGPPLEPKRVRTRRQWMILTSVEPLCWARTQPTAHVSGSSARMRFH